MQKRSSARVKGPISRRATLLGTKLSPQIRTAPRTAAMPVSRREGSGMRAVVSDEAGCPLLFQATTFSSPRSRAELGPLIPDPLRHSAFR